MTAKEFAAKLTGREMDAEITKAEELEAEQNGLVVVYGFSDDLVEFRGAIDDEVGCYNGGKILLTKTGVLQTPDCG